MLDDARKNKKAIKVSKKTKSPKMKKNLKVKKNDKDEKAKTLQFWHLLYSTHYNMSVQLDFLSKHEKAFESFTLS